MPIVDIPGVGQVEFPDSMSQGAMASAAQKLHRQAKVKAQLERDRELYKPTGGFMDNIVPAAGAQMASMLRAVGAQPLLNRIGLDALPQSKEEAEQTDAALDAAPGGTTGRILGGAALAAPTAFIPGANTYLGASLIGAGTGALTTEGGLGDRAKGAAAGLAGGLLGKGLGDATPALWRAGKGAVKGLLEPLTEAGQERIAGRAIQRFSTRPIPAATGPSVTGAVPTLAEAAADPGLATLQRAVASMDPEAAAQFLARQNANNAARVGALESIAGTGGQREFFGAARNAAAQDLYGKAFATDASQNLTSGLKGEITKLMKRPAIQAAKKKAAEIAANEGKKLDSASVEGMHYMKLALDDAINGAGQQGIGGVEKGVLIANRDRLVSLIERLAPDYAEARATYAAMSKPLNQMDIGQRLLDTTRSASADLTGNRAMQAAAFARAMNNEESLIKNATGRATGALSDVMEPQQMGVLSAIRSELDTIAGLDKAANGPGSQTAKMLASQNLLKNIAGPLGMPDSWIESGISQSLLRPVQFGAKALEPRIHAKIAAGLLDPAEGTRLLQIAQKASLGKATPSELELLSRTLLQAPARAGLLEYTR